MMAISSSWHTFWFIHRRELSIAETETVSDSAPKSLLMPRAPVYVDGLRSLDIRNVLERLMYLGPVYRILRCLTQRPVVNVIFLFSSVRVRHSFHILLSRHVVADW